jgi:hypothetical protein
MELGLLRFNGFNTLYPELVTADGKRVHRWKEQEKSMRNRQAQESDFPIVEQGKSVTIPLQADLFCLIWQRVLSRLDGGFHQGRPENTLMT